MDSNLFLVHFRQFFLARSFKFTFLVFILPDFDSTNYSLRCGDISKISANLDSKWIQISFLVHFSPFILIFIHY